MAIMSPVVIEMCQLVRLYLASRQEIVRPTKQEHDLEFTTKAGGWGSWHVVYLRIVLLCLFAHCPTWVLFHRPSDTNGPKF